MSSFLSLVEEINGKVNGFVWGLPIILLIQIAVIVFLLFFSPLEITLF